MIRQRFRSRAFVGAVAAVTNILAQITGANVVVTGDSSFDLSAGTWGFNYSYTDATLANPDYKEIQGAASSQSISFPFANLVGYAGAGNLYVQAYYSTSLPGTGGTIVTVGSIFTLVVT